MDNLEKRRSRSLDRSDSLNQSSGNSNTILDHEKCGRKQHFGDAVSGNHGVASPVKPIAVCPIIEMEDNSGPESGEIDSDKTFSEEETSLPSGRTQHHGRCEHTSSDGGHSSQHHSYMTYPNFPARRKNRRHGHSRHPSSRLRTRSNAPLSFVTKRKIRERHESTSSDRSNKTPHHHGRLPVINKHESAGVSSQDNLDLGCRMDDTNRLISWHSEMNKKKHALYCSTTSTIVRNGRTQSSGSDQIECVLRRSLSPRLGQHIERQTPPSPGYRRQSPGSRIEYNQRPFKCTDLRNRLSSGQHLQCQAEVSGSRMEYNPLPLKRIDLRNRLSSRQHLQRQAEASNSRMEYNPLPLKPIDLRNRLSSRQHLQRQAEASGSRMEYNPRPLKCTDLRNRLSSGQHLQRQAEAFNSRVDYNPWTFKCTDLRIRLSSGQHPQRQAKATGSRHELTDVGFQTPPSSGPHPHRPVERSVSRESSMSPGRRAWETCIREVLKRTAKLSHRRKSRTTSATRKRYSCGSSPRRNSRSKSRSPIGHSSRWWSRSPRSVGRECGRSPRSVGRRWTRSLSPRGSPVRTEEARTNSSQQNRFTSPKTDVTQSENGATIPSEHEVCPSSQSCLQDFTGPKMNVARIPLAGDTDATMHRLQTASAYCQTSPPCSPSPRTDITCIAVPGGNEAIMPRVQTASAFCQTTPPWRTASPPVYTGGYQSIGVTQVTEVTEGAGFAEVTEVTEVYGMTETAVVPPGAVYRDQPPYVGPNAIAAGAAHFLRQDVPDVAIQELPPSVSPTEWSGLETLQPSYVGPNVMAGHFLGQDVPDAAVQGPSPTRSPNEWSGLETLRPPYVGPNVMAAGAAHFRSHNIPDSAVQELSLLRSPTEWSGLETLRPPYVGPNVVAAGAAHFPSQDVSYAAVQELSSSRSQNEWSGLETLRPPYVGPNVVAAGAAHFLSQDVSYAAVQELSSSRSPNEWSGLETLRPPYVGPNVVAAGAAHFLSQDVSYAAVQELSSSRSPNEWSGLETLRPPYVGPNVVAAGTAHFLSQDVSYIAVQELSPSRPSSERSDLEILPPPYVGQNVAVGNAHILSQDAPDVAVQEMSPSRSPTEWSGLQTLRALRAAYPTRKVPPEKVTVKDIPPLPPGVLIFSGNSPDYDSVSNLPSGSDSSSTSEDKRPNRPKVLHKRLRRRGRGRKKIAFCDIECVKNGTFGDVYTARDAKSGELVIVKKVCMEKKGEGVPIKAIRELRFLQLLDHQNIANLRAVITDERDDQNSRDSDKLYFYYALEDMEYDLAGLLKSQLVDFNNKQKLWIIYQVLNGISYCHSKNVMHRDIKCKSILMNNKGQIKIADFGAARLYDTKEHATNVVSLWYRPPEILLGDTKYGPPVDIWSCGCVLGELFAGRPMFPGIDEMTQLQKIFKTCGTPTLSTWPSVEKLPLWSQCPQLIFHGRKLQYEYKSFTSYAALQLLDNLLQLDPQKRLTADGALKSDWLKDVKPEKISMPELLGGKACKVLRRRRFRQTRSQSLPPQCPGNS